MSLVRWPARGSGEAATETVCVAAAAVQPCPDVRPPALRGSPHSHQFVPARLDDAFYGLPPSPADVFASRCATEAVHELGHVSALVVVSAGCDTPHPPLLPARPLQDSSVDITCGPRLHVTFPLP